MVDPMETTFTWTIKQFDMCPHSAGEHLESPKFSVGPYEFCVWIYPRGEKDEFDKCVSVCLRRLNDCGATEVSILYGMCIDDDKGLCTVLCHPKQMNVFRKRNGWGRSKLIERQLLLTTKRHELLPNNDLTIKYKISLLAVEDIKNNDGKLYYDQASERLSRDFQELLKTGIHSDMTIIVSDSRFNVHRAVLECRCPQLTAQLKGTGVQNEYTLPDIEEPVLQILLQYLYAGTCNVSNMYEGISFISTTYCLPDFRNVFPYAQNISASSEISISRLSFKWNISDFQKLQSDQKLVYPAFYYSAHKWNQIEVVLTNRKIENGSKELQLKFRKMCASEECFIRCKITFSAVNSSDIVVKEWEHVFKNENWIPPLDMQSHQMSGILCEDTLNLSFEFYISNKKAISKIETVSVDPKAQKVCVEIETINNLKLMQHDYHTLHSNPKFSDITVCVGDSKFPAHKAILCARSPVVAKMFEHDMLEKKEGVITIKDMDSSTVSSVLQYVYCGYIDDIDIYDAISVYSAADKYELLALKDICSTFLKSSINAENISDVLVLADAHHDESLKRCVYEYMTSHPESVVLSEIGMGKLNDRLVYPNILKELLEYMSSLKTSNSSSSN